MREGLDFSIGRYMIALIIVLGVFVLICIVSWIVDTHRYVIRQYEISDNRIKRNMRFVLLSDLHNKEYGVENQKLIKSIHELNPDAILIAGDLCNGLKGHDFTTALNLVRELNKDYALYYGFGNHEYRLRRYPNNYGDMWDRYSQALSDIGVHIMDNEHVYLEESNIDISAVTIEREFYKRFRRGIRLQESDMKRYLGEARKDAFELLIAHNPEYFKAYSEWGADLTVSGHVHGGIMRLPFVGGIVSPRLIEFPRYSDGQYTLNNKNMIVSCGLGTHTIHVRVFNPAELSVIDLISK